MPTTEGLLEGLEEAAKLITPELVEMEKTNPNYIPASSPKWTDALQEVIKDNLDTIWI